MGRDSFRAGLWKFLQVSGTKVIFLVRLVVVAHLLTPEEFGLLAIAAVVLGFLLSVTDVGLVPALIQREEVRPGQEDAAWTIGLARAAVVTAFLFVAAPAVAAFFQEPRATPIIQVLALRAVLEALTSIRLAEHARSLRFRPLAITGLSEALVNTVVSIALATTFGVWALVLGALAGAGVQAVVSYVVAPRLPRIVFDLSPARELLRFGRWMLVIGIVAAAGSASLQAVISRELGVVELGLYFLAARLAFLPWEISSGILEPVGFSVFSRLQHRVEEAKRTFRTFATTFAILAVPAYALIFALAPPLVAIVLGPNWEGTVPAIRLLAISAVIGLVSEMAVPLLKGMGHARQYAGLEALQACTLVAAAVVLTGPFGLPGAAGSWICAMVVGLSLSLVYLKRYAGLSAVEVLRPIAAVTAISAGGGVVAWGVASVINGFPGLIAGSVVGLATIGALLARSDALTGTDTISGTVSLLAPRFPFLRRLAPRSGTGELASPDKGIENGKDFDDRKTHDGSYSQGD